MEKPYVLGLCLTPEDEAYLQEALKPFANVITSLSPPFAPDLGVPGDLGPVLAARAVHVHDLGKMLSRLAPGLPWPSDVESLYNALSMKVTSSRHWLFKNLVAMATTTAVVYVVDDLTARNIDVASVLVASKMLGGLSVGLLPVESRTAIDTTQLTLTDAVVGAEEPRAIAALLGTLKGGPTSSG